MPSIHEGEVGHERGINSSDGHGLARASLFAGVLREAPCSPGFEFGVE